MRHWCGQSGFVQSSHGHGLLLALHGKWQFCYQPIYLCHSSYLFIKISLGCFFMHYHVCLFISTVAELGSLLLLHMCHLGEKKFFFCLFFFPLLSFFFSPSCLFFFFSPWLLILSLLLSLKQIFCVIHSTCIQSILGPAWSWELEMQFTFFEVSICMSKVVKHWDG